MRHAENILLVVGLHETMRHALWTKITAKKPGVLEKYGSLVL